MSKLFEGAKFKTNDEREAWFASLTPDEQAEVMEEINVFLDRCREIFEPMIAEVVEWWKTTAPVFMKVIENFSAESEELQKKERHWKKYMRMVARRKA